jgi:hypothetical protein
MLSSQARDWKRQAHRNNQHRQPGPAREYEVQPAHEQGRTNSGALLAVCGAVMRCPLAAGQRFMGRASVKLVKALLAVSVTTIITSIACAAEERISLLPFVVDLDKDPLSIAIQKCEFYIDKALFRLTQHHQYSMNYDEIRRLADLGSRLQSVRERRVQRNRTVLMDESSNRVVLGTMNQYMSARPL